MDRPNSGAGTFLVLTYIKGWSLLRFRSRRLFSVTSVAESSYVATLETFVAHNVPYPWRLTS
jgi:hypothetical protein